MNKIPLVAISLTVGLVILVGEAYGQTNNTETETRTFMDCYSDNINNAITVNALSPVQIDVTNPDIKEMFKNLCVFNHEKTGSWVIEGSYGFQNKEFINKYYSNGFPESVKQLINDMNEIAELDKIK